MFKNLKETTHNVIVTIDDASTKTVCRRLVRSAVLVIGVNAIVKVATVYVETKFDN